ncbi:RIP metalloprotease RseP [Candidatus Atelocyanobacterium thalassae]|uniref:Zinc metalloprotease n=1 Tax=cyanobacterium endosymbiont of Braarudosphaera bigelowii TaxID=1285375 RepID=A0ABM7U4P3_9CHRO|nr:RIP metalloprotease RseP [Candidatus Atelocyanobacterium thalassa]BDA39340.1 metalloprotease MmpA [cyanobacterium endosymbiont of Braarudosphaera bigelowii]
MSTLAAITVLVILIVVHELGHFFAARLQGIHVKRFSIGFGPVLAKYQGTETEYTFCLIPLGGFVGFPDDDPESTIAVDDSNLLRNRPILDRAIVISSGVIANLVFAYFLFIGQTATMGIQNLQPGLMIPQIDNNSAAMVAGIKEGDVILSIDQYLLKEFPAATTLFVEKVKNSIDKPLNLTIKRKDEILDLTVIPNSNKEGRGKIGVGLLPNIESSHAKNLIEIFVYSSKTYLNAFTLTIQGFWQLISHFQENVQQIAGPVKIVEYGASIAQNNFGNLFQFGALISINLAIINILPLPALDGGQLVFLLIEGILGKPLPTKFQESIMQTGLVLLLGLGIFVIIRDTASLTVVQEFVKQIGM